MRGEALNLKPIVPRGELHGALETLLRQFFARDVTIKKLDRRISEYCSSFVIEELDVALDDGTKLALVFKDLSQAALLKGAGRVKPWFFYDPMREIETYRRVLVLHQLGTATCYGAVVEPDCSGPLAYSNDCRHLVCAAKSFRVDVQSIAQSRVRQSQPSNFRQR